METHGGEKALHGPPLPKNREKGCHRKDQDAAGTMLSSFGIFDLGREHAARTLAERPVGQKLPGPIRRQRGFFCLFGSEEKKIERAMYRGSRKITRE